MMQDLKIRPEMSADFKAMMSKFWKLSSRWSKKPYNKTRRKEFFRYFANNCIDYRDMLGIEDRETNFLQLTVDPDHVIGIYNILLHYIDPSNSRYEWDSFKLICGGIGGLIHNPRLQLEIFKKRPLIFHEILEICFYFPDILEEPHEFGNHGIKKFSLVISSIVHPLLSNPMTKPLLQKVPYFHEILPFLNLTEFAEFKEKLIEENGNITGMPMICENCKIFQEEENEFKKCSRCNLVLYCSKKCQRIHWKQTHKFECEKIY